MSPKSARRGRNMDRRHLIIAIRLMFLRKRSIIIQIVSILYMALCRHRTFTHLDSRVDVFIVLVSNSQVAAPSAYLGFGVNISLILSKQISLLNIIMYIKI